MNEYINNTNEAQKHFFIIIEDLKTENKQLRKAQNQQNFNFNKKNSEAIKVLEDSVCKYMEINNEMIRKYEKVVKEK